MLRTYSFHKIWQSLWSFSRQRSTRANTSVNGLLDDISFIATDNGLTLNRINWEPEVKHEFSTELPMRIEVVGTYHELGKFTADMAALPRIVILDSFQLSQGKGGELIGMSMQAKTYKYNGKTVEKKP